MRTLDVETQQTRSGSATRSLVGCKEQQLRLASVVTMCIHLNCRRKEALALLYDRQRGHDMTPSAFARSRRGLLSTTTWGVPEFAALLNHPLCAQEGIHWTTKSYSLLVCLCQVMCLERSVCLSGPTSMTYDKDFSRHWTQAVTLSETTEKISVNSNSTSMCGEFLQAMMGKRRRASHHKVAAELANRMMRAVCAILADSRVEGPLPALGRCLPSNEGPNLESTNQLCTFISNKIDKKCFHSTQLAGDQAKHFPWKQQFLGGAPHTIRVPETNRQQLSHSTHLQNYFFDVHSCVRCDQAFVRDPSVCTTGCVLSLR